MTEDRERIAWNCRAMEEAGVDALLCSLPHNVLLLSGYWPVVGTAVAVATRDGAVGVIAPQDEIRFAQRGWADPIQSFKPNSLRSLSTAIESLRRPLGDLLKRLGLQRATIACDCGQAPHPASYSASHLYGDSLPQAVHEVAPKVRIAAGDDILAGLRARLTRREIERVEVACEVAQQAFRACGDSLRPGLRERDVDGFMRAALARGHGLPEDSRAHGFAWCMSGPNSARASAAYAHSTNRRIQRDELVLVHCNSYVEGFWTDITRTFYLGRPSAKVARIYEAVQRAREAALAAIRPGVTGQEVDRAARATLEEAGFGDKAFPHSTGHGIGFVAIDANARPRLHPKSHDVLETGMVFNVEPAVYLEGFGGVRECEMVAAGGEGGAQLLTPFLNSTGALMVA